jgi:hypothetical protein
MNYLKSFTPQIISDNRTHDGRHGSVYMTFALEMYPCNICGRIIYPYSKTESYWTNLFPRDFRVSADAQRLAAGLVLRGFVPYSDTVTICEVCVSEGRGEFTCFLCNEKRSIDLFHSMENQEPFCEICYKNRTAKEWLEGVRKAEEKHQWDGSS